MTQDIILYWLPYIASVALVVTGVYFLWKSLFADRGRGHRRCPKCWYDMAYTEGSTCSECGHVARRESDFNRTRRHLGRASLALIVCVVTILGVYWKLTERGLFASLPTSVLIMAMPVVDDASSEVFRHIRKRLLMGQVSEAQRKKIIERSIKGDWSVSPPEDGWIRKYGDFLDSLRRRIHPRRNGTEFHELEKPLQDVAARVFLDTHSVWPTGSRARIRVRTQDWWPIGYEIKLNITPHAHPDDVRSIVRRPNRSGPSAYVMYTDELDASTTSVTYDVEIFRRRADIGEVEWEAFSSETITLPLNVSDSLESAIKPIEGEKLTAAMKRAFGQVTRWTGGPQPVRFNINYRPTIIPAFDDTAIGISMELMHDGKVARQLDIWWIGGEDVRYRGGGHEVPFEDVPLLLSINQEDLDEHWKLRIRSNPQIAMRAGDVSQYWKGEFILDIGKLSTPDQDVRPKARNWWIDEDELVEIESAAR